MERAVEALVGTVHGWEVTHDVSLNASLRIKFSSTYDAQAFAGCLSAILAERASREKPEPRYEAKGHVVFDGDKAVSTAYCFDTKEQARAVAKSLNDLEARP
jgi:hypothetical protein